MNEFPWKAAVAVFQYILYIHVCIANLCSRCEHCHLNIFFAASSYSKEQFVRFYVLLYI